MPAVLPSSRAVLNGASAMAITAAFAAPMALGASPGGFALPTATPTPTSRPEVEGPADDTGVVPLAPRVIPTDAPTPAPTAAPSPQPTIAPVLNPTDSATPAANSTGGPATVQPLPSDAAQPQVRSNPSTVRQAQPDTRAPSGEPVSDIAVEAPLSTDASASVPGLETEGGMPVPAQGAPISDETADEASAGSISLWMWIAGGLAILAALIAGLLFVRRKQTALAVPEIERPKIASAPIPTPAAAPKTGDVTVEPALVAPVTAFGPARINLALEIVTATRSMMNFTLDYRLTLANREAHAVRDVSVAAILTSAQKQVSQSAALEVDRLQAETVPRIGPSKSHSITGQVQLPTAKLQVLRQGNKPLFVPLLQITIQQGDLEPQTHHYVVGLPSSASSVRLHPIPLDTPPGGIPGLRVRELEIQPA